MYNVGGIDIDVEKVDIEMGNIERLGDLDEKGKARRDRNKWNDNSVYQKDCNEYKYKYIKYFVTNWVKIDESLYTFWPILRFPRDTTRWTFPNLMYKRLSFGRKYKWSRFFEWFDAGTASNYLIDILFANLYIFVKATLANRRGNTLHGCILLNNK